MLEAPMDGPQLTISDRVHALPEVGRIMPVEPVLAEMGTVQMPDLRSYP
jgi:hypothetical protein